MSNEQFLAAWHRAEATARGGDGIGTLREKALHAALKYYLEPDSAFHEQKIGDYIADIARDGEMIEVQTRGFERLRPKLAAFLPDHFVTVVYPMPHIKYLHWVDPETGEISDARKSPKRGRIYDACYELYKICPFLGDSHLSIRILLIDLDEYRYLNGWSRDRKRGSTRADRIPRALVEEYTLGGFSGWDSLLPDDLPARFTAKAYARAAHVSPSCAQRAMRVLSTVGAVEQDGKDGRAYLYKRTEKDS